MNVIYQPKGRALEYSDLACNLYLGCSHGCKYCYAPACMRSTLAKWESNVVARKDVITSFERDAVRLASKEDKRYILFSFLSNPYQPIEGDLRLTRQALSIVRKYGLNSKILTKGQSDLIDTDLPLMKEAGTQLGVTLCFTDDQPRQTWEPHASTVSERMAIIKKAHQMGIKTWISLEPVIDPDQALDVIRQMHPWVDSWKVGKLNHQKDVESKVDWKVFRLNAESLLAKVNASYYIKESLRKYQ